MMKSMKHCYLLGKGVGIGYNRIYHCDCPTIEQPAETIITSSFEGGDFPLDLYLDNLRNLVILNNGDVPPCGGCLYLRKTMRPNRWRGYFDNVSITATTKCNFKCLYCNAISHHPSSPDSTPYDLSATVLGMCKIGLIRTKLTMVHWGGGEPVINRDFENICRNLTEYGVPQRVNTNAGIYSEAIADMLRSPVKSLVRTSIDAGSREVFKQVRGVDAFDHVWRNVEKYLHMDPDKMLVKYIVIPENCAEGELRGFVERCVIAGVKKAVVVHDYVAAQKGAYGQAEVHAMGLLRHMLVDAGITVKVEDCLLSEAQKKGLDGFYVRLTAEKSKTDAAVLSIKLRAIRLLKKMWQGF